MTTTIYLDKPTGILAEVARVAFPAYTGRHFKLRATDTLNVASYWDGGSRDYFVFVRLADMKTLAMPAQSAFDPQIKGADNAPVPQGFVCVEHTIFCGKDHGLTFHVNPADMTPFLSVTVNVPWEQRVVLYATRSLKSSYNGDSQVRFHEAQRETGITLEAWDTAKQACITAGYLNRAGAITVAGRNVVGDTYGWPKRGEG